MTEAEDRIRLAAKSYDRGAATGAILFVVGTCAAIWAAALWILLR